MTNAEFDVPSSSPNFRTHLAKELARLAPEIMADGKLDVNRLAEMLGDDTASGNERFGLVWPGKREAQYLAQTPSTATLLPDRENSIEWESSENVFIEGDNLEVLKVLQKHYYGKIKMIYIDPPYNTGKDFVYADDFRDGVQSYLEWTKQVMEAGKTSSNAETAGRYHSNWLNMMYPRLKLARNLLTQDGMIFISIDDVEQPRLRMLCDEIFGDANFVSELIWKKGGTGKNDSRFAITEHEYILVYAKNIEFASFGLDRYGETTTQYNYSDEHGDYSLVRLDQQNLQYSASLDYDLVGPDGAVYRLSHKNPQAPNATWRWSREKVAECMDQLVFKNGNVYTKNYKKSGVKVRSLLAGNTFGVTRTGKKEAEDALGIAGVFDFPKPARLVKYLVSIATEPHSHDLILDFFAGSGTTAQSVYELNAEDAGNRRVVLVQIPEPTPEGSTASKSGFRTLSEVARARIAGSGANIARDSGDDLCSPDKAMDLGFRAYKLAETNFQKWRVRADIDEEQLGDLFEAARDSANDEASPEDLFAETLIKLGFSLTENYVQINIAGLDVFSVEEGLVLGYFNEHLKPSLEQLRELVDATKVRFIILEDAFQGDDELKTNLVQLCKTRGIDLSIA